MWLSDIEQKIRKPEDSRVLVLQLGFVHDATEVKCQNSSHERTQILLSLQLQCETTLAHTILIPPTSQALHFQT